jgi:rhamnulokinase
MSARTVLAVDIGAESGRVIAVRFDGKRLSLEERYRFANTPVKVRETLHWDMLRLWHDVGAGLHAATESPIASIGIDTWAIDFGLIDRAGNLVGNPVHYRDRRTEGVVDRVFAQVPRSEVFMATGIQILPFNTLYQLASLVERRDPVLESADRLLTVPDLLYYWLTGLPINEFTNATTTQCFDCGRGDWAFDLLDKLTIPTRLFKPVTMPGATIGGTTPEGIPVTVAPHHDTGAAVVGVPATGSQYAYLSSGTWSLLGLEVDRPVINAAAFTLNVTNEGGYGGTTRLLKNIMGLWLIQQTRHTWANAGQELSYDQIAVEAEARDPFVSLVDPDATEFLAPGDIPARIRAFCRETGQPEPISVGALARCIFESLALKYRHVLRQLIGLTGHTVETLHVVGGGSQNALLCQMTADACGIPVLAGPVEATALGNAIVQLIALGELQSVAAGRTLIRESFPLVTYTPRDPAAWDTANLRFQKLMR